MARPRARRDHVRCPDCKSNWVVKNGKDRGKQTYLCRDCNRRQTPSGNRRFYPEATKKMAAAMYKEGSGASAIGRVLGVNVSTVQSWVKKKCLWAKSVMEARRKARPPGRMARAISIDEMRLYLRVRKGPGRNSRWIWTGIIEWPDGSRTFDFVVGDRQDRTFQLLLDRLPLSASYHTDRYGVYRFFPRDQHVVGKGGKAIRNEGIHSLLRDSLYRLRRATKGYTKSLQMLKGSIALVALKKGWV